jgi:hypothetical protein
MEMKGLIHHATTALLLVAIIGSTVMATQMPDESWSELILSMIGGFLLGNCLARIPEEAGA